MPKTVGEQHDAALETVAKLKEDLQSRVDQDLILAVQALLDLETRLEGKSLKQMLKGASIKQVKGIMDLAYQALFEAICMSTRPTPEERDKPCRSIPPGPFNPEQRNGSSHQD
jgi:hypothetical protein